MLESSKVPTLPADSQRSLLPLCEPIMHSRLMTLLAPGGPVLALVLAKIPNLMALYVFGSQVRSTSRPDSDLDLSVLAPGYIDPTLLWSLSNEIASLVSGDVDLLDLRAASTVMQYQVLSTGQVVWDIGLQARLFEVAVLSEKLALDEAREPLLRTISREGYVYAR